MLKKIFHGVLSFADRLAGDFNGKREAPVNKDLQKDFKTDDEDFIGEKSRQESLKSSQGTSDFSGSSYNGPGNVDREKRNSNMSQRNY